MRLRQSEIGDQASPPPHKEISKKSAIRLCECRGKQSSRRKGSPRGLPFLIAATIPRSRGAGRLLMPCRAVCGRTVHRRRLLLLRNVVAVPQHDDRGLGRGRSCGGLRKAVVGAHQLGSGGDVSAYLVQFGLARSRTSVHGSWRSPRASAIPRARSRPSWPAASTCPSTTC